VIEEAMTCQLCGDEGPRLEVDLAGPELPDDVDMVFEFDCGRCGTRWQWRGRPGAWKLVGIVEKAES
jgi:hypothetical protein